MKKLGTSHLLIFGLIMFGPALAASQTDADSAAAQLKHAFGELQLDLGYDRRENDTGTSSSASTVRRFRVSAQQHYLIELPHEESSEASTLSLSIGARTDRSHWSPIESEQVDVSLNLGWMTKSWLISVGYIFFAHEKTTSSGVETQNQGGSGITASGRYFFWWNDVGFGPSLTFDSIRYARTQTGSLPEVSATQTRESMRPGLALGFRF